MSYPRSRLVKILLWNWWARSNTVITTSSEQTDYGGRNTLYPSLQKSWRSVGVSDAYIQADMAASRTVEAVALVKTNLTNAATFRVRVGNDATMATTLYDSGTLTFHEPIYSSTELLTGYLSEFFDTAGIPTSDTRDLLQQKVRIVYLPSAVNAEFVRVDVSDAANPAGYLELPYVFAGRVFSPSPDLYYEWNIARTDTARTPQAGCGQYWSASVFRRIHINCTVAAQKETDFLGQWFLFQYLAGVSLEFIISIEDLSDSMRFFTTIFAKFANPTKNVNHAFKRFNLPLDIEEISEQI